MATSHSKTSKNVKPKSSPSNSSTKKRKTEEKPLVKPKLVKGKKKTTGLETCGFIYSMPEYVDKMKKEEATAVASLASHTIGTGTPDCNICCTVGVDGFKYCYDGNEIRLDNYPTSGGPWMPAIYPNGTWTWVNGG